MQLKERNLDKNLLPIHILLIKFYVKENINIKNRIKMKKIILTIVAIFIASSFVSAHPAKKVNLTYKNGVLKIEAVHGVKDPAKHYIKTLQIKVDDKVVKEINLDKQSSSLSEVTEVSLPGLKKGAKIKVKSTCSQFGSKQGKLTVE